jgi:uncharacterized protein (DUF305 family)
MHTHTTNPHIRYVRAALAAGALTLVLFTAACGGSGDSGGMDHNMGGQPTASATPKSGATFNATDVQFATDMIPHHRQAVEMAKLAETKATTPAVKDLAGRISKAQEPEIATMSGWLTAWGEPVPSAGAMDHGMDHGMPSMPGMMSQQEMQQLTSASGTAFDKMFLTMMIKHHEGAVEMARTEQDKGVNPAAKKLAGDIATSQTAEIAEMESLLDKM